MLAVGGAGVWEALDEVGLLGVGSADDQPVAIIQGWGGDLTWNQLNEAAIAIHRGAHWVATNTDPTRPTDRGIVPGNGAAVAAVTMAVGRDPEVAGKPYRPLMDETVQRLGAAHPIFVGDRLDTDIAGAHAAGLDSMLVLHRCPSAGRPAGRRPDQPTDPSRVRPESAAGTGSFGEVTPCGDDAEAQCGQQRAVLSADRITVVDAPTILGDALDAVWATAQLSWWAADAGRTVDGRPALDLDRPCAAAVAVG